MVATTGTWGGRGSGRGMVGGTDGSETESTAGDLGPDDALIAVTAHGLLNSTAVLLAAADALRTGWHELAESDRDQMLDAVYRHATVIAGTLEDVVRGLPPSVSVALDRLTAESRHGRD